MSLVAGSMLGIGIFLTPRVVAEQMQHPVAFFGVWVVAGVTVLCGAVAYAELGAMMPRAGGDYVYLEAAYGPSVAFGAGWVIFGAVFTGSIAALAVPLCQYQIPALIGIDLSYPVGFGVRAHSVAAIVLIVVFTSLNVIGARLAGLVQDLTTWIPMAGFGVFAVWAILFGPEVDVAAVPDAASLPEWPSLTGFAVAFMAVYFAYSGWNAVVYVAGEVRRPGRNIPLGILGGTVAVMVLYLLMCAAFVGLLGMPGLTGAYEAGTAAATVAGGPTLGYVGTLLIAFGLIGTLNGTILSGARVAYAMAESRAIWGGFRRRNEAGVPERALWVQALWASLYVLSGTFEDILALVSLAMIVIGSLTVSSVYVLRRQRPEVHRPYRATGYPWVPLVFLLMSLFVLLIIVGEAVRETSLETLYPLFGVPVFLLAFVGHWAVTRLRRV
jgi:APA family basic amino acid/polyamine antiporter